MAPAAVAFEAATSAVIVTVWIIASKWVMNALAASLRWGGHFAANPSRQATNCRRYASSASRVRHQAQTWLQVFAASSVATMVHSVGTSCRLQSVGALCGPSNGTG